MPFRDRRHAGRLLAEAVARMGLERPVVVALPRGGVPVAYEVARALGAPLDVLVARKLGAPYNPEFGVGALAEGGVEVYNPRALASAGVTEAQMAPTVAREQAELSRRLDQYREGRSLDVQGRPVVLVDDGLATGITAVAAVRALRQLGASPVVLAAPVGAPESCAMLEQEADDVLCLERPPHMGGVGAWYEDFSQTSDWEVRSLLEAAGRAGDDDG
jgi:putative phosphoribosyl transferase